jgi:VanZ family protein
MRPAYWLPPAVWMGVILWLGSGEFSSEETGFILGPFLFWLFPLATPADIAAWHGVLRKLAHVTVYAILALLWYRAFARGTRLSSGRVALLTLAVAVAWACVDEGHQSLVPSRTASLTAVAIDSVGASAAVGVVWVGWRALAPLATALLWTAAIGGTALIGLNLLVGVGSGALWVTTPIAAAILLLRRRPRF